MFRRFLILGALATPLVIASEAKSFEFPDKPQLVNYLQM